MTAELGVVRDSLATRWICPNRIRPRLSRRTNRERPASSAHTLNCLTAPRGLPDLDAIDRLLRVLNGSRPEVEVWIPEPVLWEWSEHTFQRLIKAKTELGRGLKELSKARIASIPGPLEVPDDVEVVVAELRAELEGLSPKLRILDLLAVPEAAFGGLRDQVLQLGAATKKGTESNPVKTGASDSASCRLIEAVAGGRLADVVLVSRDTDVSQHFCDRPGPRVAARLHEVHAAFMALGAPPASARWLEEVDDDDDDEADEIAEYQAREEVEQAVRDSLAWYSRAESLASIPFDGASTVRPSRNVEIHGQEVLLDRIVSVYDVDVELSDRNTAATAMVEVSVDVTIDYAYWDHRSEMVEADQDEESDVQALARVTCFNQDGTWNVELDEIELFGP